MRTPEAVLEAEHKRRVHVTKKDRILHDLIIPERMLEFRLALELPTVITIERYGLETVNLRSRTVQLLE